MRRFLLATCFVLFALPALPVTAEDPPGAYRAPSPEPTPEETLMLEYINRARANPKGEIELCLDWHRVPDDVDREMFATEMAGFPAAPPIFFDLDLLAAARWHSYYMGFNEMEHDEIEGARGFTAVSAHARMRLAGYSAGGTGENIIKFSRNPWHQHVAFVIDWGEGPGNMQPGRGHRANIMSSAYRVVGVGAVEHPTGDDFATTADFGGGNQRYVGGVVYNDEDGDRFYDLDEGVGGVPFNCGETTVRGFRSGAYTLPVSNEEGWVKVMLEGKVFARYLPAGTTNIKIDVLVSDRSQFISGSELLADLEEMDEDDRFRRLLDVGFEMQGVFIQSDNNECDRLLEMLVELRQEVVADQERLTWAVQNAEIDPVLNLCDQMNRKYRRTWLESWFTDAEMCARMRKTYIELADALNDDRVPGASALTRSLRVMQRQFAQIASKQWQEYAQELGDSYIKLGQTGEMNPMLLMESDIDGADAFAEAGAGFGEATGFGGGGGSLWMAAPIEGEGAAAPADDSDYEESPFSLE